MPKVIELTVEIEVQKVTCPGVWLCQDGRVSLTMFALGTSYQTCLLPPVFPLTFRDIFYFRKRFQESCALNNICCLLKGETIYCELVQWCDDCDVGECVILAQYLGAMNDVLFPPNMCSTDGVDLLMRRSKDFPGILSPKIEIATKVRIDEVWNQNCNISNADKILACKCSPRDTDTARQKQVCHSAQYHRNKCVKSKTLRSRSRSRTRSEESKSCCSLIQGGDVYSNCRCPNPMSKSRTPLVDATPKSPIRACAYQYTVCPVDVYSNWNKKQTQDNCVSDEERDNEQVSEPETLVNEERLNKLLLESQYVDRESSDNSYDNTSLKVKKYNMKATPCICEICRRYHEIFHSSDDEKLIITQNK